MTAATIKGPARVHHTLSMTGTTMTKGPARLHQTLSTIAVTTKGSARAHYTPLTTGTITTKRPARLHQMPPTTGVMCKGIHDAMATAGVLVSSSRCKTPQEIIISSCCCGPSMQGSLHDEQVTLILWKLSCSNHPRSNIRLETFANAQSTIA